MLANPDPRAAAVREARDLTVHPHHPTARLLGALAHPDFALIRREWQTDKKKFSTEIQIDHVREALQVFQMSAAFGGWRVCIVDCAEDLNRNSANALLKMIEEPPQRSLILIVSHRPGQVLPTLRSRCRKLKLEPLSPADVVTVVPSLGPAWSELDPAAVQGAAARAERFGSGGACAACPSIERRRRANRFRYRRLPTPDPRMAARLADAVSGREAEEAYQAFHRELYDWLASFTATVARGPMSADELGGLWDRIRTAARETETLNLDRRVHVLAIFAEIAETAQRIA